LEAGGLAEAGPWHEVVALNGARTERTQPFPIKGKKFRLRWSYKGSPSLSPTFYLFGFQVYPKGDDQLYVAAIQRGGQPDSSGVEVVEEGPGEYYLLVVSEKLQSWSISIEDFY